MMNAALRNPRRANRRPQLTIPGSRIAAQDVDGKPGCCVESMATIRRRRRVQRESISAIARDIGLSRNTVKRTLKLEGDGYECRRRRPPMPKLGPFRTLLDRHGHR